MHICGSGIRLNNCREIEFRAGRTTVLPQHEPSCVIGGVGKTSGATISEGAAKALVVIKQVNSNNQKIGVILMYFPL